LELYQKGPHLPSYGTSPVSFDASFLDKYLTISKPNLEAVLPI
jgi:hypothetical protein